LSDSDVGAPYQWIYDYEWEVVPGHPNQGKGDLVMTDGLGSFLVIEVKNINLLRSGRTARTKRSKSRREVGEQIKSYAIAWRNQHTKARIVLGATYTNEEGLRILYSADK